MKTIFFFYFFLFFSIIYSIPKEEEFTYSIKLWFIDVGFSKIKLKEIKFNKKKVVKISSETSSNSLGDKLIKVRDSVVSIWDKKNKVSLMFEKNLHERNYRQKRIHYYYHDGDSSLYMDYNFKNNYYDLLMMKIEKQTQDPLTAFFNIREMKDIKENSFIKVNITSDMTNFPTEIYFLKNEKLGTIFGEVECIKIEPRLKGEAIFKQSGYVHIWITNDEKRIPVLLESRIFVWKFKASLEKYEIIK